jgi:superfamily II DNA or RNA helicase
MIHKEMWPFQHECLTAVFDGFDRGLSRVMYSLPTGNGKTHVFVKIIEVLREDMDLWPALIVAHRDELLSQAMRRITEEDDMLRIGVEGGDRYADPNSQVIVGSVQSLKNPKRLAALQPRIIVIDEVHHMIPGSSYDKVLFRYGAMDGRCLVVGCTATPKRLDRKALHSVKGALIEEVVYVYTIRQAIRDKYLVPLRGYQVRTQVVLDDVHKTAGEYNQKELAFKVIDRARTESAFDKWSEVAGDRKTIAFGVNVAHAKYIADFWNERGVKAGVVWGEMDDEQRHRTFKEFERGDIQLLSNCGIATEGYDCPSIDCVLLLRPTLSWVLYTQMVGRGTRICSGKQDCIVIDMVDVSRKMSPATLPTILDLPYEMDLEGHTLEEAAVCAEKIEAAIKAKPPRTWKELITLSEEVNILGEIELPQEISNITPYKWLSTPTGYVLYGSEVCTLDMDQIGKFRLHMKGEEYIFSEDLSESMKMADKMVRQRYPQEEVLLQKNAMWNMQPISINQKRRLESMKVDKRIIATLNRGSASILISQKIAEGKGNRFHAQLIQNEEVK